MISLQIWVGIVLQVELLRIPATTNIVHTTSKVKKPVALNRRPASRDLLLRTSEKYVEIEKKSSGNGRGALISS